MTTLRGIAAKMVTCLAGLVLMATAQAVTIDAIYFAQTHVQKATDPYFGTVGGRDVFIKVHVTDPATPASPAVTATLSLGGQTLVVTLTGPATLPASIPDGLGVVQHTTANSFTGILPAAWVKTGLQVTVNAGGVVSTVTNMKVTAPTKVIMTMTDVQYFSDTNSDYPAGTFAELEAKWPVADLEVRRLRHVVFPELVIPPRTDVGTKAERIRSKAEYTAKTGLPFDGEQAAALAWNGALKRAAGRSGRWSLYYLNVYNAFAGGQAGGFAGVGAGNSIGILHHELGHAMSLPHWGDSTAYPYKGNMHGINAPSIYNGTHAGPIWAFHLPTRAFIPPTTQTGNAGGKPVGTYKADPMQGGGEGWQEPAYLMNHFSDYSVNQMRNYINGHVVVWNPALNSGNGSWAQWNQTAGDYTTAVSNNGVEYPTVRDTQVISIMASISGSDPDVTMVYPPIGPYTAGLIRLFDPNVPADRTAAQSIFSPTNGSDLCVRVVQGGMTKTYMLAASWLTTQDEYSSGSLVTEAINLPAADGAVTKIELLLTPNVEDVGLPANPQVLSTWAPLTPEPAAFESVPKAYSSSAVTMKAVKGAVAFGFTGTVDYMFTETTGNPGATSSAWQTSPSYTDTGLLAGTPYSYTVSMRAGTLTTTTSAPASATTLAAPTVKSVTVNSTQEFSLVANLEGFQAVTGLGAFDAGTADKLVVVVSTEDKNNSGTGYVYDVRYNGKVMTEAIQEEAGSGNGAAAIFYLDNPGPKGTGTIEVSAELPNGGMGAAYALSGTMAGFAVTNSRTGTAANSVSLTTAGQNSVVIAVLENSGNPNASGEPTVNAAAATPLTEVSSGSWGSGWGGHASGYRLVTTPSAVTPAFTTNTGTVGGAYSINIAAAEFPGNPPQPNVWSQTAGGTQAWTTAANWDDGVVPNPTNTTTMDFSTADIAADTNLVLGANRTVRVMKFGDFSGTQNWTFNAGNTMTLAGSTPTIEVKNNTTQFNNVVAGAAGLAKTGAGTLFLNGANTYTGVTRISAGTLQAATLTNGGSNSSIGAAANAASNLILNGGTLQYTGAAVSTNRLFSLQATSTLDASGTGAVNFNNTGAMGFSSSTADKTLTLTGSNTEANTIAAIIGDNIVDVTGMTSVTKSGTGTWVLSGANTYSGNTTVSGGILRLTSNAALGSSPLLAIGGNRLEIGTNTAFAGPVITMQAGTIVSDRSTAGAGLTHVFGGTSTIGNGLSNFIAGANVTSGTAAIQLGNVSNNNGSTATPGLNPTTANLIITGNVTLGTSNTGTANLTLGGTGSVNSIAGIIENGTRATGNVIKSGTSTWTLSGLSATAASNYNGSTTIDQGMLRFTTTSPSLTGGLTFGSAAAGTNVGSLDLSAASATFGGAFLVRTNSTTGNTISIGNGRTLQLNGAFTVGYNATATPHSTTELDVTGAGTLSIGTSSTPTNAIFQIGNGATTNVGNAGILDLSGLTTFYANLGSGLFRVGSPTNVGSANGGASSVILAANSTIQAATILLGGPDGSVNSGATAVQSLKLGSGTNVINVDTLNLGGLGANDGRSNGSLTFNGVTGTLKIRSLADPINGHATLNIGVRTMDTGVAGILHLFDTTGHSADLRFSTMTIGSRSTGGSLTGAVTADFRFDTGTLNANDLIIGSRSGTTAVASTGTGIVSLGGGSVTINNTTGPIQIGINTIAAGNGTGTLNISGGTVSVLANAGTSIRIADATVAGGTATGTLNLTGGTLTVAGDILRGANTGTSNATVKLSGGTLNMGGHDLGAAGSGALNFIAESGTLQNVASINGTGGLTKTTAGTLLLQGANNYFGGTTISAGTLALGASNVLPATAISIGSATLNAATFTDTVGALDVTGTSVINLGSGAALAFADSSAIDWTGGTLTITGTFVSGSSLRFGINSSALTAGQLSRISKPGGGAVALNASGFLIDASYSNWASTNAPGTTPTEDYDGDGVSNAVEYVLGGSALTDDMARLPAISPSGENILFTFQRAQASINATTALSIQVGTTMLTWPNTYIVGTDTAASSAGITVLKGVPAGFDTVTLSVPRAPDLQKFIRLNVTITP
ncbi:MAG: autotransporter-associated beta strand repeat-containing protein [Chthoniobacteraceae bacterium]